MILDNVQEYNDLSNLSEATNNKNLLSSERDEKINSLMKSIDNTNYRYGRSTLSLASAGFIKDGICEDNILLK